MNRHPLTFIIREAAALVFAIGTAIFFAMLLAVVLQ